MGQMWTITRRETLSLAYSPIAYVAVAVFIFLMSIAFALTVFVPSAPSDMTNVFYWSRFILFFVTPLLTMSLFSEEFKTGRMEMLRTSPISPSAMVFGKFLGGLGFYVAIMGSMLLFVLMLTIFGGPDYRMMVASFLGLFLMGMLYVSVGLFFSACTQSQLLAAIGAFLTLATLNMLGEITAGFSDRLHLKPWLRTGIIQSTVGIHFNDFAKGIVDVSHAVYFLTTAGFFIFLTYLVLESRNWRR